MPIFWEGIRRGKQGLETARIGAEEFGSPVEVHRVPWKGWESLGNVWDLSERCGSPSEVCGIPRKYVEAKRMKGALWESTGQKTQGVGGAERGQKVCCIHN